MLGLGAQQMDGEGERTGNGGKASYQAGTEQAEMTTGSIFFGEPTIGNHWWKANILLEISLIATQSYNNPFIANSKI